MKVKQKTYTNVNLPSLSGDEAKDRDDKQNSYMDKLFLKKQPVSFWSFGHRCFGKPGEEVPLPMVAEAYKERFKEVPISKEYQEWCKPWKGSLMIIVLGK